MHSLLKRQIKKLFGSEEMVPENLQPFIAAINEAYQQSDADRAMLERSLEISSEEMRAANAELRALHAELENRIQQRTAELFKANELLQVEIAERRQVQVMQDAFYRIAQAAEEIQSLNELYPKIHQIILAAMPAENFYIALYNSDQDLLDFVYYADTADSVPPREIHPSRSITAYILRTGKSLLCDQAAYEELERQGEVELLGPPSPIWLGVPLVVRGRAIGVMAVQHYSDPRAFGPNEQRILEFVSTQVARAIERKRAEEALRERETRYSALIRNSVDNITVVTADGTLLYENDTVERPLGYPPNSLLGENVFALVHPDDRPEAQRMMEELLQSSGSSCNWTARLRRSDGTWLWMEGTATNLLDEPAVKAIVFNYRDVTGRIETQAIIDRQNRILLALNKITPVLMGRLELEEVLRTIVQQAAQLMDTPDGFLFLVEEEDTLVVKVATGLYTRTLDYRLKHGDGVTGTVLRTGRPLAVADYQHWEGRSKGLEQIISLSAMVGIPLVSGSSVTGVIGLSKSGPGQSFSEEDVELLTRFAHLASIALENARLHSLVQQELAARNEAERNLRRLTDNMQDIITQIDAQGTILYASPSHRWIIGIDPEEAVGRSIFEHLHPDDVENARSILLRAKVEARKPDLFALRYRLADGTYLWMECSSNLLVDEAGQFAGAVISSRDITRRKVVEDALQESEQMYRLLADNSSDVIWVRDMDLRMKYISPAVEKFAGYTVYEALAMPFQKNLTPASAALARQYFAELVARLRNSPAEERAGEHHTLELEMTRKDGTTIWTETTISVLRDAQGEPQGFLGVTRDITERRRVAEELRHLNAALEERVRERTEALSRANQSLVSEVDERIAAEARVLESLQEKEVLLREIHHRVKNNLQIISSLLNLQAHGLTDEKTLQAMRDSQMRVRSMALIHEKLYQSNSLASIEFGEYIKSLAHDLFIAYRREASGVRLNIQVDKVSLNLDHAISCGLILNELMTNALKYAFPDGRPGTISIELRSRPEGVLTLRVSDDGIGISPDLNIQEITSLGLQLVTSLARQLDATIEQTTSAGTTFLLTFRY
jgi:PAS domain S-box-containing protein